MRNERHKRGLGSEENLHRGIVVDHGVEEQPQVRGSPSHWPCPSSFSTGGALHYAHTHLLCALTLHDTLTH